MPVIETAAILKLAFGIAGVGLSLYKKGLTEKGEVDYDETFKSIFGQFVGGVFYDLTKGGASAFSFKKLKSKYANRDLSKDNLNHDLQKAARKSQLIATFFAAQYCLEQLKTENSHGVPSEEKGFWTKTAEKAKKATIKTKEIFVKDSQKEYLAEVIKYLNEEIKDIDNFKSAHSLNFDEIKEILNNYENSNSEDLQKSVSTSLKADMLAELEMVAKILNSEFDQDAFNFLKMTIEAGWEEFPKEKIVSEKFISLDIYRPKPSPKGKKYDWFNLLCSFFNEEYKTDSRVEAAAQKQLFLDISNHFGKSQTEISELVKKISDFVQDIAEIKADVKEIKTDTKDIKDGVGRIEKELKSITVKSQYYDKPQTFVALPNRTDKAYGRKEEIEDILTFLKGNEPHAAIIAPSCFGKTFLIKKFFYKTLDAEKVKDEFSHLFEKVIYIDCDQNKLFISIVQHFATLIGKKLKYAEGGEANFLQLKVFSQIQTEKILLIFDNFETWVDSKENYLNEDIRVFVKTLLNSNHQIRALFVSQRLPHNQGDFVNRVKILGIGDKLLTGLTQDAALELIEKEGKEIGLDKIKNKEVLITFLEDVNYIPQAIQSMIGYIAKKEITFSKFIKEFEEFEKDESREFKPDERRDKLRPTKTLLKMQIEAQSQFAKHLLSLMAFFDNPAPEEILTIDFSDEDKILTGEESENLRIALGRLKKHFLVRTEKDEAAEYDGETGEQLEIVYYFLHPYIRKIILENTDLPRFEIDYQNGLETYSFLVNGKAELAFNKNLYEKLKVISECEEKIEAYLVYGLGREYRKPDLSAAINNKILGLSNVIGNIIIEDNSKIIELGYLESIEINPNNPEGYGNYGNFLHDTERLGEAEKAYNKAIELNPNYAQTYNNLGFLFVKLERFEEAEQKYNKAIELNPNYADAYNNLGILLTKDEKRWKEAEEKYNKAIELNPNDALPYYNLACLNSLRNNRDEAFDYLKKSVEMDSKCKSSAKSDSDFDNIRDDARFREIVGEDA